MSIYSDPAHRRYRSRFMPITFAYVAGIGLATWLIPDNAPASALTIAIAALPGLAVIGWIWAMARLLVELDDEYLRLLEVRKAMVATGVTMGITSFWGILELFSPEVPKLPVFLVFPIWCLGLGLGQLVNWRAFGKGAGDCP